MARFVTACATDCNVSARRKPLWGAYPGRRIQGQAISYAMWYRTLACPILLSPPCSHHLAIIDEKGWMNAAKLFGTKRYRVIGPIDDMRMMAKELRDASRAWYNGYHEVDRTLSPLR